jgi:2-polyprenyl-6-methoxyphenol hydroxylase-like FAD-dependent oxidoreductase
VGPKITDLKVMNGERDFSPETTAPGWTPFCDPLIVADDGRFLLDHFLGRFSNPFYRINSEADVHDDTIDQITREPLSLAEFTATESSEEAPDDLQRQLGRFLAESLVNEHERLYRRIAGTSSESAEDASVLMRVRQLRDLNPFRLLLAPALERHLMEMAAARCGRAIPAAILESMATAPPPEQLPVPRANSAHEERFRQRIADLKLLRSVRTSHSGDPRHRVLIVGAGPAGLIRAISATLRGLETAVIELRPENAAKRPQIAVIRSQAVIGLLDQLGVIDFLFKEGRIFPLGRLRLEVSLADLELAFKSILRLVTPDDPDQIVQYGTSIERIDQDQGSARVVARSLDRATSRLFLPQLIVIADGGRSPTSRLLGIPRCDHLRSHTGIIAIFRADGKRLSRPGQIFGELSSKLNYAFHRYVSREGTKLEAGTILQVPGHHYLGLDLAPAEENRLRDAMRRAQGPHSGPAEWIKLRRLLRFWAKYGFETIRTEPKGSAPHSGGRRIPWLPLDAQLTMPIDVVSDRAAVFGGYIGETFVAIEGDAQFTIHPGSAYGCTKAFLSARLFDFLLQSLLPRADGRKDRSAELVFFVNSELMARECARITRFFRVTA